MKISLPIFAISISLSLPLVGSLSHSSAHDSSQALISKRLRDLAKFTNTNGYSQAIPLYRAAADETRGAGRLSESIHFLNNLGACQLGIFQFQAAAKTLTEARTLALQMGDRPKTAYLDSNLSTIYKELGNLSEAAKAAEEGALYADTLRPEYRARSLAQLASVRAESGQLDRAEPIFAKAIDVALQADTDDFAATAALAWDALGYARFKAGRLEGAEAAATEGFRLRRTLRLAAVDNSLMNLGKIRAARGDLPAALTLMDQAEEELHRPMSTVPAWVIYMERGRLRAMAGNLGPAMDDLRKAVALAREWRVGVVANDANRTSSEETLAELYGLLIDAGNRLYFQNGDAALIRETFEAAEENRAASLRALVSLPNDWRKRLPNAYWDNLGRLQAAEAAWIRTGAEQTPAPVLQLRSVLAGMEAAAGAPSSAASTTALDRVRQGLDGDSAFFGFQLGAARSWTWAVTADSISLHGAPAKAELAGKIRRLQQEAQEDTGEPAGEGVALYRGLFGSLDARALARRHWIVALDGDLFDLPFAALRTAPGEFLIEKHSLRISTGALMLGAAGEHPDTSKNLFLAVGDPVYNRADARANRAPAYRWPAILTRARLDQSPPFARLWGTEREVKTSAQTWGAAESILLTGPDASRKNFWAATKADPSVIHIATHILDENDRLHTGWVALSLNAGGDLDYLTPGDILAHSISARLVVLSGCSSGKAEVRTASGLMGLTRAWIAAGAGAVLATRWPTVDDDGAFFESFYRHLRSDPPGGPAEALTRASLEMMKSGSWRAKTSFWAGYFLVGN